MAISANGAGLLYPAQTIQPQPKVPSVQQTTTPFVNGTGAGQGGFNSRATVPTQSVSPSVVQQPASLKPVTPPQAPPIPQNPQQSNSSPPGFLMTGNSQSTPNQTSQGTVNQQTSPWLNTDGSVNSNYVPKDLSLDPAFGPNSGLNQYQKNQLIVNYSKANNIPFDASQLPTSPEDELQLNATNNQADKNYLDQQIDYAISKSRENTSEAESGVSASLGSVNREGATSQGNQNAAQSIIQRYGGDQANLEAQYAEQKRQLALAQARGDSKLAGIISSNIASTEQSLLNTSNQNLQQTEGLLNILHGTGALVGLSSDQLNQVAGSLRDLPPEASEAIISAMSKGQNQSFQNTALTTQSTTLDLFNKAATSGVQMTPEFVQSTAEKLGVKSSDLQGLVDQYNTNASQIQGMKGVDEQTKQVQLQQLQQNLNDSINGLTTSAAKNAQALQYLYKTGAPPDVIQAFKESAGIWADDPQQQAQLALTQAQTAVQQANLSGQPVTVEQKIALGKAIEDAINNGIDPTQLGLPGISSQQDFNNSGFGQAYVPTNSLDGILGNFQNGKLTISCPPSSSGLQCGAGVNRFWGLSSGSSGGMPDSYAGKQALVDKNGIRSSDITDPNTQIKPGMAFVMPEKGEYAANGHTGIVTQNLGNGSFSYVAWDDDGNGHMGSGTMTTKQVYGFANPPSANVQIQNVNGQSTILTPAQVRSMSSDDLQNAVANGAKFNTAAFKIVNDTLGADTVKQLQSQAGLKNVKGLDDQLPNGLTLKDYVNTSNNGRNYLSTETISDSKDKAMAEKAARNAGIPVVTKDQAATLEEIDGAMSALKDYEDALNDPDVQSQIPKDWTGRPFAIGSQDFQKAAESNPKLASLGSYSDATIKVLKALAGTKGLRINRAEIANTSSTLPVPGDTQETIKQKFANIRGLIQNNEDAILGKPKSQNSGKSQSGGLSGFLGDLFGNGGGNNLVQDHHTATGQYAVPEDHPVTNYQF